MFKKIVSLTMIFAMCITNLVFADDVVIVANSPVLESVENHGVGPASVINNFILQDYHNGPAAVPSTGAVFDIFSQNNNNTINQNTNTPVYPNLPTIPIISNTNYNYTNVAQGEVIGYTNTVYAGPTVQTITSPADNNAKLANAKPAAVITSGMQFQNNVNNTGAMDKAPVVKEISSPGENEAGFVSGGPAVTNQTATNNPGTSNNTAPGTTQSAPAAQATQASQAALAAQQAAANQYSAMKSYTAKSGITVAAPTVTAPSAIAVNATSKEIYFSKNPFTLKAPAALVNMLTAYLLVTHKQLTDIIYVSNRAVNNLEDGASTAGLRAGDTMTVKDAIAAMFVKSCCDVANASAEAVGGSIENFVTLMNQTAKSFGCLQSNFVNPTGLNSDAQVTTAYDMAIIMDKVTEIPSLVQLMNLSQYTLPKTSHRAALTIYTKNTFLTPKSTHYYTGILCGRMGYTSKALYTMTSEIVHNNQKLMTVVLNANGSQFSDSKKLLDFAKKVVDQSGAAANANQAAYAAAQANKAALAAAAIANTGMAGNMPYNNQAASVTQTTGVNTQGNWQQDGNGIYFVKANGTRAANEWIELNGKRYCVDANGYMIKGLREFSNGKTYYFDESTGELRYNTWVNLSTGAYYLQQDGSLAKAAAGQTANIVTSVGTYTIDSTGKAIAKVG